MSGRFDEALALLAEAKAIYEEIGRLDYRNVSLDNETLIAVYTGRLSQAIERATTCLANSDAEIEPSPERWTTFSMTHALSGHTISAAEGFAIANILEKKDGGDELYSVRGIRWGDLLVRTGHEEIAERLTLANLAICEREHWNEDCARCHSVLSRCALAADHIDEAREHVREAEGIFQRGQFLFELAQLHIVVGRIALAENDGDAALARVAEALSLAQPRGMRLVHADALVLRGCARLIGANNDPDVAARALDDAEEALRIARDSGYAWAERDALMLQATALLVLANAREEPAAARHRADAERAHAEAAALSARLRLTDEDLRQADLKAAAWLEEWEKKTKSAEE